MDDRYVRSKILVTELIFIGNFYVEKETLISHCTISKRIIEKKFFTLHPSRRLIWQRWPLLAPTQGRRGGPQKTLDLGHPLIFSFPVRISRRLSFICRRVTCSRFLIQPAIFFLIMQNEDRNTYLKKRDDKNRFVF